MTEPIHQAIYRNTSHKCKCDGCNNFRTLLSGYCKKHFQRVARFGNPLGKTLVRREYLNEFEDVTELLKDNLTDISTVAALGFIQNWLDSETFGSPCINPNTSISVAKSVNALDILIESTSIYLYSQRKPHLLPDNRELSCQMGWGVLRLCPNTYHINLGNSQGSKYASDMERRNVGQYLRDHLGLFFINVMNTLQRQLDLDREFRESLFHPLGLSKNFITVEGGRKLAVSTPTNITNN